VDVAEWLRDEFSVVETGSSINRDGAFLIPATASWSQTRGGRILVAVTSGAAVRALSSLASLVSIPLAVRYLGSERFGVWATIISTVAFLNLFDLGIASTLTNHIARSFALGDRRYAARYTTNALTLTVFMACAAGITLALLWPHVNWSSLFGIAATVPRGEVSATMTIAATLILIGLPASLAGRILAGYQQICLNNLAVACGTAGNLAGLFVGITLRVSMPWLFLMSTGCLTLCNLVTLASLWKLKPWLRPRLAQVALPIARELLASGSGFFLIQIAGVVVFSSDNVVVGHYLGAAQVTPYNVTWRLVGLAAVLQSLIFPALWPAYAEAHARGDIVWMRRTFRLVMYGTLGLNVLFAATLIVFGKPLVRWWVGEAAVPTTALLAAMALWAVISGCMTADSCLLAAVGRTRLQGILSIVAAAVNLTLSIVLVQRIGALGVIAGTILSYVCVLVVPQTLMVRSVLNEPHRDSKATQIADNDLPMVAV
jgi:O-antigen/teichoic acid export membrane protein